MIAANADQYSGAKSVIPIRNVWYLLLYAWNLSSWQGRFLGEIEKSPEFLGLLARVLVGSTRDLLKRNLSQSFLEKEKLIRGVRGRIDFAKSLKSLSFESGHAYCNFSTLDSDSPRNRIIRSTLDHLARDTRLEHSDSLAVRQLRQDLRELAGVMDGVRIVPVTSVMFRQVQLGGNDCSYTLPLAICGFIHHLELPTEDAGDRLLAALLRDEITFHDLFEKFLRNFWQFHLTDYDVKSEYLEWFDELGCKLVPTMRTDITITQRMSPHSRLVIDAKYYKNAFATNQFGGSKFISENLYQIYAYLRTQEHRGDNFLDAEGMLIYPTTAYDMNEAMRVQGHRIRVSTVDLSQPWQKIEERLINLVVEK